MTSSTIYDPGPGREPVDPLISEASGRLDAGTGPESAARLAASAEHHHDERGRGRWSRGEVVAVGGLLVLAAVLYLWDLGASGWANSYYSAAVQAGTKSWKAFLFGSFDASNLITVDKAPGALWPMEIAARLFGLSSWSILVPQALMGVASVGALHAAVRRWHSAGAALLAGLALALTPVAALMFRFNNPDALLVLLLTTAAYALVRALERGSTKWLLVVGTLIGWAFLAKMLQAFLVVPAFALVYLVAAPTTARRRLGQLLASGAAMLLSGGWWVAVVELWPAGSRPYIGGSQDNSVLNLIFGYNGIGRLNGNEAGSVVGAGGAGRAGMWGSTGIGRLFADEMGGQIAWLLPAALVLLATMLVIAGRRSRTDRMRASALIWGGWLLTTGAAISFGAGIIHPYYTVALAPAVAALVGIGAAELWQRRTDVVARITLASTVAITSMWAAVLLDRTPDWVPVVRWAVLIGGLVAAGGLLAAHALGRRALLSMAALAIAASLGAPAGSTLATVTTPHTGSLPSAGPDGGRGMPGGGPGRNGNRMAPPSWATGGGSAIAGSRNGTSGRALPPPGTTNGRLGLMGGPRAGGGVGAPAFGGGPGAAGSTGGGGLLEASTPSTKVLALLAQDAGKYSWVAATIRANQAAGYQLESGGSVMAIGGFNGTDPAPTLARFQQYVAEGRVHWFIASGGGMGAGPGGGEAGTASAITSWVEANFTPTTVDGVVLYDLTAQDGAGR